MQPEATLGSSPRFGSCYCSSPWHALTRTLWRFSLPRSRQSRFIPFDAKGCRGRSRTGLPGPDPPCAAARFECRMSEWRHPETGEIHWRLERRKAAQYGRRRVALMSSAPRGDRTQIAAIVIMRRCSAAWSVSLRSAGTTARLGSPPTWSRSGRAAGKTHPPDVAQAPAPLTGGSWSCARPRPHPNT